MILKITPQKAAEINRGMIGLFFEDINYSADGGLYAEMIENRSFEFVKAMGTKDAYYQEAAYDYGWGIYPEGSMGAKFEVCGDGGLNDNNPHFLRFTASGGQCGFYNKAYDGITMQKGMKYNLSFYARSNNYRGKISAYVKDGDNIIASCSAADGITDTWLRYSAVMTADDNVRGGKFIISLSAEGTVDFDMISLMPQNAVAGIFRKDLYEMLRAVKPGFIRFPGGCIVEGNTLDNRYKWKESLGDISERKNNWSRWAVHTNMDGVRFPYYNQSLGIGYYEYFILCELLGAKPIPIVNVGLACEYQSHETVDIDSDEFQTYIDDALDLIEFANGTDTANPWVRKRIEMGHKEPFDLEYLGIGNEQWQVQETEWNGRIYKVDFFERYEIFERAIHERYPQIRLLGSAGPNVLDERYRDAWAWALKKASLKGKQFMYAMDEHYYKSSEWFRENTHFYDNYLRDNISVFAGEYAAGDNTWEAALAEAAFLTGIERNADVVKLISYAPLFARIGYTQWQRADMIYFDDLNVYGTPNYYVQKLFAENMGTYTLNTEISDSEEIYQTVSYDEKTKQVIIKIVNISEKEQEVFFEFDFVVSGHAACTVLKAESLKMSNSISSPVCIYPEKSELEFDRSFSYILQPFSFAVLCIE